jgi:hypothetical protein
MTALSPVDAVLSVGQRIGRYFAHVSMIPALLLVIWTYMLISSGSLSGRPTLRNVEEALSHWSVGKAAGIVLVSLAVAIILHPLQFVTTQLLEGYWGTSPLGLAAMKVRILHHRRRQRDLVSRAGASQRAWHDCGTEMLKNDGEWQDDPEADEEAIEARLQSEVGDPLMLNLIADQELSGQADRNYPDDPNRIMPTRLGNALRRFEDGAGESYGLKAVVIAPHLHLVAPPGHLEYLIDSRQEMDSAIRLCTVGLIASALTVGCMLAHGLWLLWTLVPYSIGYLAYKGAVSAAQSYGVVIKSVIDLDRFILYKELGLYAPRDNAEERETNAALTALLTGKSAPVTYRRDNAVSGPSVHVARPGRRR